jgi:hypothetical protein
LFSKNKELMLCIAWYRITLLVIALFAHTNIGLRQICSIFPFRIPAYISMSSYCGKAMIKCDPIVSCKICWTCSLHSTSNYFQCDRSSTCQSVLGCTNIDIDLIHGWLIQPKNGLLKIHTTYESCLWVAPQRHFLTRLITLWEPE